MEKKIAKAIDEFSETLFDALIKNGISDNIYLDPFEFCEELETAFYNNDISKINEILDDTSFYRDLDKQFANAYTKLRKLSQL